ncbi:histone H1-like [Asterias rubens]|uniref:histone H1-like n=1 Tax=Asterias rubens TaxID=7604 RepID=UPI001455976E|nr:histone H1-like [Asterias rubens]
MADSTVFENGGDEETGKRVRSVATHPKTIDMLMEALRDIDTNPRKGTSVPSVKKWIGANYPEAKLGVHLKNAFTKALATGAIERPKDQADVTAVLVGRYRLGKPPKPAAKVRAKKEAAGAKAKKTAKEKVAEIKRGRSASPKASAKKPFPRPRARSVSATPKVSRSKRVRSRLSKSHSPLRTPMKVMKPKTKTVVGKKKTATSPAAKKAAAAKPTKKSTAKSSVSTSPVPKPATKTTKKTAKAPAKATKTTKAGKTAGKDAASKKK